MNLLWNYNDALLLQSILISTGDKNIGADLKGILNVGDFINRTVFTSEEIRIGLENLISIEYLTVDNNKIYLTDNFFIDYKSITPKGNSLLKQVTQLEELLKTKSRIQKNIKIDIENENKINIKYIEHHS